MNNSTVRVRLADLEDVAGVTACVCAAYYRYIQRIGKQPGPMLEDYSKVIHEHQVHVVERDRRILSALVLVDTSEGLLIDNVAVDPSSQGTGVGRLLLEFAEAEARRRGLLSIYLSTNERMTARLSSRSSSRQRIPKRPRYFVTR